MAAPPPRVAIVDDDELFRESLGLNLADEGYQVVDFADGQAAVDYFLAGAAADVMLLDWRMPRMDGPATLRRLRDANIAVPVIFLTVLGDDTYEEAALEWGAVDFIDKSRRLSIILKRLKLITDGEKQPGDEVPSGPLRLGGLELSIDGHRARWRGRAVALTLTEFNIVRRLATQVGQDLPYRQIYDLVHGKGFISGYGGEGYRSNVRSFIKRIRRKFRQVDDGFRQIENYPGFGYRWAERDPY